MPFDCALLLNNSLQYTRTQIDDLYDYKWKNANVLLPGAQNVIAMILIGAHLAPRLVEMDHYILLCFLLIC
jgi:hypothetical protein